MVSDIRIFPRKHDVFVANGKAVINDIEVVFSIVKGSKGLFVSFPSDMRETDGEKKYYPHIKILDEDLRADFSKKVLAAYEKPQYNKETVKNKPKVAEVPEETNETDETGIPF